MSMSLDDVLINLRRNGSGYGVSISLTIHSQADDLFWKSSAWGVSAKNVYYGYGSLRYFPAANGPRRWIFDEYLETYEGEDYEVKVLHNNSYSTDQSLNGGWDEPQTFLVKEPPAEMWKIRIDPKRFGLPFFGDVRIPFGILPPSITVSTPGVALPSVNWSIDLTDDNAFLRGIGPDPVAPNEKALYVIAFGDIIGPPV